MKDKKIIKVPISDGSQTPENFGQLMLTAEKILNEMRLSSKPKPSEVEEITVDALKNATELVTCFRPSDIKLVSGMQFPDIKIEKWYGAEVKTSLNGWSSIGSSIIESTRIANVEWIYMVFGNLKESPAQFRCRPYQDVLTDIKVTHSPRYEINMNTDKSVFDEMGITYDLFRKESDYKKIERAQIYARRKLLDRKTKEMPWWIKDMNDNGIQGNIKLWSDLTIEEKRMLTMHCMILFPEVVNPKTSPVKYNDATLWLCSYHQIVSPNIRDIFSAGGQKIFTLKGNTYRMPQVFCRVRDLLPDIKRMLTDPNEDLLIQMQIYNPSLFKREKNKRYEQWLKNIVEYGNGLPLKEYLKNPE